MGKPLGIRYYGCCYHIHDVGTPMVQGKSTTDLSGLPFQFMGAQDSMLSMLEWLCSQMMEAKVSSRLGAEKHEQSPERTSHRCASGKGLWIPDWTRCTF